MSPPKLDQIVEFVSLRSAEKIKLIESSHITNCKNHIQYTPPNFEDKAKNSGYKNGRIDVLSVGVPSMIQ